MYYQSIFRRHFDRFWSPKTSQIKLSPTRDAQNQNHTFSISDPILDAFWPPKWMPNPSKMHPKNQQKIRWILHWKKVEKWTPSGGPGGVQRTSFSLPKFSLGPLGHPKGRQRASRRSPGRFFTEFGADFMIFWSFLDRFFFDFLPSFEETMDLFCNWQNKYLIEELLNTSWNQLKNLTNFDKTCH